MHFLLKVAGSLTNPNGIKNLLTIFLVFIPFVLVVVAKTPSASFVIQISGVHGNVNVD